VVCQRKSAFLYIKENKTSTAAFMVLAKAITVTTTTTTTTTTLQFLFLKTDQLVFWSYVGFPIMNLGNSWRRFLYSLDAFHCESSEGKSC